MTSVSTTAGLRLRTLPMLVAFLNSSLGTRVVWNHSRLHTYQDSPPEKVLLPHKVTCTSVDRAEGSLHMLHCFTLCTSRQLPAAQTYANKTNDYMQFKDYRSCFVAWIPSVPPAA